MNYQTFKTLMEWARTIHAGITFKGNKRIVISRWDEDEYEMNVRGDLLILTTGWTKNFEIIVSPRYLIDTDQGYIFKR